MKKAAFYKKPVQKIFDAAPTHIPTNDNVGEPSFLTKTDRHVLTSIGMENLLKIQKWSKT